MCERTGEIRPDTDDVASEYDPPDEFFEKQQRLVAAQRACVLRFLSVAEKQFDPAGSDRATIAALREYAGRLWTP